MIRVGALFGNLELRIEEGPCVAHDRIDLLEIHLLGWDTFWPLRHCPTFELERNRLNLRAFLNTQVQGSSEHRSVARISLSILEAL